MAAKKRTQTEIPGTERFHDDEVSTAAADLHEVRSKRMKLTTEEGEAAARLMEVMEEKGLEDYVDDDLEIRVQLKPGKVKVSVTKHKAPEPVTVDEGDDQADAAE